MITLRREWPAYRLFVFIAALCSVVFAAQTTSAQTRKVSAHSPVEEPAPAFNEYRGIHLGMTADEVRKKLGEPRDKGTEQDFFMFNDLETVQIVYDKAQKVVTISADFLSGATDVLTPKQIFGAEVEAKADGSMHKMVRYPKAGYWMSYIRTSGVTPLTSVVIQKIQ